VTWLDLYLAFTRKHEAPTMFHLWVGFTLISAVLGRKCYLDKGFYTLYPNLFTVLVAGSARCKKTTAIDIGRNILGEIDGINVVGVRSGSREKLLGTLIEHSKARTHFICADELAVFLSKDVQGAKLMDDLVSLFNCPDSYTYDTFSHGKLVLKRPYVVLLAGGQPETLEKTLPDLAVGGGYASRNLFVYQRDTDKERSDFQILSKDELSTRDLLKAGLERISLTDGQFHLSRDAMNLYQEWYRTIETTEDHRLDGFIGRKHDHVLKVSMLLCASEVTYLLTKSPAFEIQSRHIQASIEAIDTIQGLTYHALAGIGGQPQFKSVTDKILRILERHKRLSYSDLMKKCYPVTDAKGFREAINTLSQSRMVLMEGQMISLSQQEDVHNHMGSWEKTQKLWTPEQFDKEDNDEEK
jgi:Protein of unknown function (DUF3987)